MPTRCFILTLLAFALCDCTAMRNRLHRNDNKKKDAAKPEKASEPSLIGTVEMLNPESRFVLVRLRSNFQLTTGVTLTTVDAEGKTAKIKVTPERKGLSITADIVEGDPHQGDLVVTNPADAEVVKTELTPAAPGQSAGTGVDATATIVPTVSITPGANPSPGTPTQPASGFPRAPGEPAPDEFLRVVPSTPGR